MAQVDSRRIQANCNPYYTATATVTATATATVTVPAPQLQQSERMDRLK